MKTKNEFMFKIPKMTTRLRKALALKIKPVFGPIIAERSTKSGIEQEFYVAVDKIGGTDS